MKCDQCEQEATVHELRVVNGKKVERHLCQKCARKQGIDIPQTSISVPELIEKYMQHAAQAAKEPAAKSDAPAAKPAPKTTSCPNCSTTYVEFRQTGLLGCPGCYAAFEGQLGPLLERAHEGGAHHVGKMPRRALSGGRTAPTGGRLASVLGDAAQRAGRISALRKQLDDAVQAEQYERAASLRDELRKLTDLEHHAPPEASA